MGVHCCLLVVPSLFRGPSCLPGVSRYVGFGERERERARAWTCMYGLLGICISLPSTRRRQHNTHSACCTSPALSKGCALSSRLRQQQSVDGTTSN